MILSIRKYNYTLVLREKEFEDHKNMHKSRKTQACAFGLSQLSANGAQFRAVYLIEVFEFIIITKTVVKTCINAEGASHESHVQCMHSPTPTVGLRLMLPILFTALSKPPSVLYCFESPIQQSCGID